MKIEGYTFPFEKLHVWQKTRILVGDIYLITNNFPKEEQFSLVSQMRRAAISVKSNIAEGSTRISRKDRSHFYQLSYSSLNELISQLYLAHDLKYVTDFQFHKICNEAKEISIYLINLRQSQMDG